MDQHVFFPLPRFDSVRASCSCGWISPYLHAFAKYAQEDHTAHVEYEAGR